MVWSRQTNQSPNTSRTVSLSEEEETVQRKSERCRNKVETESSVGCFDGKVNEENRVSYNRSKDTPGVSFRNNKGLDHGDTLSGNG